jgi:hypothetical protein
MMHNRSIKKIMFIQFSSLGHRIKNLILNSIIILAFSDMLKYNFSNDKYHFVKIKLMKR